MSVDQPATGVAGGADARAARVAGRGVPRVRRLAGTPEEIERVVIERVIERVVIERVRTTKRGVDMPTSPTSSSPRPTSGPEEDTVVAPGDEHDRGAETLCVGAAR